MKTKEVITKLSVVNILNPKSEFCWASSGSSYVCSCDAFHNYNGRFECILFYSGVHKWVKLYKIPCKTVSS